MFQKLHNQLYIYTQIPRSIWMLGIVSLFTDMSSELIKSLLPAFLVTILGAHITTVGVIEGIAEATALISKIGIGILSDIIRKRKPLVVIGYTIAAISKIFFPLAHSVPMIAFARFFDRLGKGIRGTPRDALIGDWAPPKIRGACFGLRESLDTVGAIIGPICAIILMLLFANNIYPVLWIAAIPGIISIIIILFGVDEAPVLKHTEQKHQWSMQDIYNLPWSYWHLIIIAVILCLARLSEAFLLLKAQSIGISLAWLPLVMVVMSCVYALIAYPAGVFSDTFSRQTMLIIGIFCLITADILLMSNTLYVFFAGIIAWGLFMGFSQGIITTMITDATMPFIRGTAYGIYNAASGIALLCTNIFAGFLWDIYGPSVVFIYSALCAICAGIGLIVQYKHKYHNHRI